MSDLHRDDDVATRSLTENPPVQTHRELVDMSVLPTGPLQGVQQPFSASQQNREILRHVLFGQETPGRSLAVTMGSTCHVSASSNVHNDITSLLPLRGGRDVLEACFGDGGDAVAASSEIAAPPPKRARIRTSYAKKFFLATSELYLDLDPRYPTPEVLPELVGQVINCPNKNNQNLFEISWLRPHCAGSEIPANLVYHLKKFFPKDYCTSRPT